jgi:surface antigen
MQRFLLAGLFAASLVTVCVLPQTAHASGSIRSTSSASSQSTTHTEVQLTPDATYANTYTWGYCTWWAAHTQPTENLSRLGNAYLWATHARTRGLSTGSTPRVGATVVFAPWVQGAWSLGHVAHVIAVSGNRFEISEMNFYGGTPRGGFGKVDYRWATAGSGVTFIY